MCLESSSVFLRRLCNGAIVPVSNEEQRGLNLLYLTLHFVSYSQPVCDAVPSCVLVRTWRSLLMSEREYSSLFSGGFPSLKNRIQVLSYVLLHSPVGNEPSTNPRFSCFFDILQCLFWNRTTHLVQRKFVLFETFRTQTHLFSLLLKQ